MARCPKCLGFSNENTCEEFSDYYVVVCYWCKYKKIRKKTWVRFFKNENGVEMMEKMGEEPIPVCLVRRNGVIQVRRALPKSLF